MALLGSLVVQMAVDLARFRTDMGTAAQVSNTRLREIQRSAETTVKQLSTVGRAVSSAFGAVGIGLGVASTIAAFERMGAAAIEFGDNMQKAAAKTGISIENFQKLAGAARLADIDLDSLSTALKKMQVAVADAGSGSKTALAAFKALGINFAEFRKLSPEQQFETLADQMSKLKDPADRTKIAVELLGKAGADLLPFFEQGAEGIRKSIKEVERLGGVLGPDKIKNLAAADEAIKKLGLAWDGVARSMTAVIALPLANFLTGITRELSSQETVLSRLTTLAADWGKAILLGGGDPIRTVTALFKELTRAGEEANAVITDSGPHNLAPRKNPAVNGDPTGLKDDAARLEALKKHLEDILPEVQVSAKQLGLTAMQQFYKGLNDQTKSQLDKNREEWADFITGINELVKNGLDPAEATRRINARIEADLPEVLVTATHMSETFKREFEGMTAFAEEAAHAIQNSFADFLFDPFDQGLKGMLSGFLTTIRRMIAEIAASALLKSLFSAGAGLGGGLGSLFGSLAGSVGKKAAGGPVMSGRAYLVGERGPEMFMPGVSGTIIPNGAGGGSVVVQNYITINDETDLKRSMPAIAAEITRQSVSQARAQMVKNISRRGHI